MMLTNIIKESTELLFVGVNTESVVQTAFGCKAEDSSAVLEGVVSRKKQVLGPLIEAIEKM